MPQKLFSKQNRRWQHVPVVAILLPKSLDNFLEFESTSQWKIWKVTHGITSSPVRRPTRCLFVLKLTNQLFFHFFASFPNPEIVGQSIDGCSKNLPQMFQGQITNAFILLPSSEQCQVVLHVGTSTQDLASPEKMSSIKESKFHDCGSR